MRELVAGEGAIRALGARIAAGLARQELAQDRPTGGVPRRVLAGALLAGALLAGALLARTVWPKASLPGASLPRTILARGWALARG